MTAQAIGRYAVGTAVLTILSLTVCGAADLAVSTSPDQLSDEEMRLALEPGSVSGTFTLILHNRTANTIDRVQLIASLRQFDGSVLPDSQLKLVEPGTVKQLGAFNISPNSRKVIALHVTDLNRAGEFPGVISVQQGTGKPQPIGKFLLVRPGRAELKIREAEYTSKPPVISLDTATEDFQFTLNLFDSLAEVAVTEAVVSVGELRRTDGTAGQVATLTLNPETSATSPLSIPKNGSGEMSLTGKLPKLGSYATWLSLRYGKTTDSFKLTIKYDGPPALEILEASGENLQLEAGGPAVTQRVTVINREGNIAVKNWDVKLIELRRKDGQALRNARLSATVAKKDKQSLGGGKSALITISGSNLEATMYIANLQISHPGRTDQFSLTVTRAALQDDLVVGDPKGAAATRWLCKAKASVDIDVREKNGSAVEMYHPRFRLFRVEGESKTIVQGQTLSLCQRAASGDTQVIDEDSPKVTTLPASAEVTYVGQFGGLSAGAYEGEVVVSGPNSTRVVKQFKVNVKDNCVGALLVVISGVLLSYGIHFWIRVGRAQDLRSAMIAEEREEILRLYERPPKDRIWEHFLDLLDGIETKNRFDKETTSQQIADSLNDIKKRRRLYRELIGLHERISGLLEDFPTEPDAMLQLKKQYQRSLRGHFDQARDALGLPSGEGMDDNNDNHAPAQRIKLRELFAQIAKDAIEKPTDALVAQLEQFMGSAPPPLAEEAKLVKTAVEMIKARIGADQSAHLASELEQARRDYADLCRRRLVAQVEKVQSELGMQTVLISASGEQVQQYLDAALRSADDANSAETATAALQLCQSGQHQLLRAQIELLALLASKEGRPEDVDDSSWAAIIGKATHFAAALRKARLACSIERYQLAETQYNDMRDEYSTVLIGILRHRMDAAENAFDRQPPILTSEQLQIFKEKLNEVRDGLPTELTPAPARRSGHWQAKKQFVALQIKTLETAARQMKSEYEDHKDNYLNNATWTETIPDGLSELENDNRQARARWETYDAASDKDGARFELLRAEVFTHRAQGHYETLFKALRGGQTMSLAGFRQGVAEFIQSFSVRGEASAAAQPIQAAELTSPKEVQLREPEEPAETQLTPNDWYRRIRTRDIVVLAIGLVVASVFGLVAIWGKNPTFGGANYFTLFLWGFAAQEGTKSFAEIGSHLGILPKAKA